MFVDELNRTEKSDMVPTNSHMPILVLVRHHLMTAVAHMNSYHHDGGCIFKSGIL